MSTREATTPDLSDWQRRVLARKTADVDEPARTETAEDKAERLAVQRRARQREWTLSAGTLSTATFDALQPQQDTCARTGKTPAVTDWLDSGTRNLLLTGPSRRGKTYTAYAVGNAAVARGEWVVAYRVARLNAHLRNDDRRDQVQALIDRVPYLILDDLGSEHTTDWTGERLQDVLDERLTHDDLRTITTTNLAWQQDRDKEGLPMLGSPLGMVERYGERIALRLVENARVVVIDGKALAGPAPW